MDENQYDQWKTETPEETQKNDECEMCGAKCEGDFCSKECEKAWFED